MIEMQNVWKIYRMDSVEVIALNDINMKIEKGEYISIIGPSGSGKSTLMNIIGCLDRPSEGEYLFNNKNVSDYSDRDLARIRNRRIGFVFQMFNLLPRYDAIKNVSVPLLYAGVEGAKMEAMSRNALVRVGLGDRLYHKPSQLSGGQQQRIAIARAIVNNPDIILADEPTGNLDTKSGKEIISIFKTLNEQMSVTVVLVTHDPSVARQANRTIEILDGSIVTKSSFEKERGL